MRADDRAIGRSIDNKIGMPFCLWFAKDQRSVLYPLSGSDGLSSYTLTHTVDPESRCSAGTMRMDSARLPFSPQIFASVDRAFRRAKCATALHCGRTKQVSAFSDIRPPLGPQHPLYSLPTTELAHDAHRLGFKPEPCKVCPSPSRPLSGPSLPVEPTTCYYGLKLPHLLDVGIVKKLLF